MSNILFLTSAYLGKPTANGICTKGIVEELKNYEHQVFVLCYEPQEDFNNASLKDKKIYTIPFPPPLFSAPSLMQKIKRKFRLLCTPETNSVLTEQYAQTALELCQKEKIEAVVAMYFPQETVPVLQSIKRKFPGIKTVIYELDSVGDGVAAKSFYGKLTALAHNRWCKKYYNFTDSIVIMQSHQKYWKKTFGKRYANKLKIADLPVLAEKTLPPIAKSADEPISLLYAGLIEQRYRSPERLLQSLEALNQTTEFTFNFYSKGDCEVMIAQTAQRIRGIKQNGYVSEEALNEAMKETDILVSIGNALSHSVPSKIITYMAYGKPILHFCLQENDVCNEYLEKYPLALIIKAGESPEEAARRIQDFAKASRGKTVDFETLQKLFPMNLPEYSTNIILEFFN